MNHFRLISGPFSAVLALAGLAALPTPSMAQAAATESQLTVERIYGEPGLNAQLARALQWNPDGRQVAYLLTTGSGKGASTELYAMEAGTGEKRVLVSSDQVKTLLPPPQSSPKQSTGAGRRPPAPFQFARDGQGLLFQTQS